MSIAELVVGLIASSLSIACALAPPRRRSIPILIDDAIDAEAEPASVPLMAPTPGRPPLLLCSMPLCAALTDGRVHLTDNAGEELLSMCAACQGLAKVGDPRVIPTLRSWGTVTATVQNEDTGATL
jgi:hypothetical protein